MSEPRPRDRFRFGPGAIATPANMVTAARLVLAVPTLILIREEGSSWLTVSLWFVLTSTDRLDGWLARRDGATRSGAFLDPLADKFLVLGGFFALALTGDFSWAAVVIVTVREVTISVYRSFAARRGISVPARQLGKWKAFLQFLAVGVVLFPPTYEWATFHDVVLWCAVGLSVISALDILFASYRANRRDSGRESESAPPDAVPPETRESEAPEPEPQQPEAQQREDHAV